MADAQSQPQNRAERRAMRKGKSTAPQQRQSGVPQQQRKDSQVHGPRQFTGRRGNR